MGAAKVMFPTASPSPSPRPVDLRVTADVHVYRFDDNESSVGVSSSRVVVVTSLSAIIKELSRTNVLAKGDEYLAGPSETPSICLEIYSQPRVRRSKKGTCLNKPEQTSDVDVQSTISRMVLLPYSGCSKGNNVKAVWRKTGFVKSSKTWENVNSSWKQSVKKRTRSETLNRSTGYKKLKSQSVHKETSDAVFGSEDFSIDHLIKNAPEKVAKMGGHQPKPSISESQILFKDERSRMYLCSPLDQSTTITAEEFFPDTSDLGASLVGFEEGILGPPSAPPMRRKSPQNAPLVPLMRGIRTQNVPSVPPTRGKSIQNVPSVPPNRGKSTQNVPSVPPMRGKSTRNAPSASLARVKSTRNVSILHRPRTRHKATSTTSLNKYLAKKEQNLDESIKGVLMPYISAGNYPSELVLKLVPKKKIEEEMKKEEHLEDGSNLVSEEDLLAPKLNDAKPSKKSKKSSNKKKRKCGLLCCFSKSKQAESDDESMITRVYYPSIVEVHERKSGRHPVKEVDSNFTFCLEENYNTNKKTNM